jgi:hypothetical protein
MSEAKSKDGLSWRGAVRGSPPRLSTSDCPLAAGLAPELAASYLTQDLDLEGELHGPTPKGSILGFQMSQKQLLVAMASPVSSRPRSDRRELKDRSGFLAI